MLLRQIFRRKKYFIFSLFFSFYLLVFKERNPEESQELINLPSPGDYDHRGCPRVPISFSGMTGRLGNLISTYVNLIALQYKLGYKFHLPLYSESSEDAWVTKPYLQSIFKNVSFPTVSWNWTFPRDAGPGDVMLFNNSRTGLRELDCGLDFRREENVEPLFSELQKCASNAGCEASKKSVWVTKATGANYPDFSFMGDVLPDIIRHHLQFTDKVDGEAREVVENVVLQRNVQADLHMTVGVHVRRTDFKQFSKFWIPDLLNETYFLEAMKYMRDKYEAVTFLVVSDDPEWCRTHLQSEDVVIVTGHSPEVDLAVMANCEAAIVDYGTFSVWGGILSGGEVVVSNNTFRDARWAADYLGWTYI